MDINNLFESAKKIAPTVKDFFSKLTKTYENNKEAINSFAKKVKDGINKFDDFLDVDEKGSKTESEIAANIIPMEVELLTKDKLVKAIKDHIVSDANGVATYLKKDKAHIYVYTAFVKGDDLLPVESNVYLIFTADGMSRDLESMFGENDLIVLN